MVICKGGLGPTVDNVMRDILAKLTDSTLELHEEVKKRRSSVWGFTFLCLTSSRQFPAKRLRFTIRWGRRLAFSFN
ncbi:MAG: hypothetical protein JSR80_02245 [Verrucomicrobia bacterium]|nr:hypothetical protein [Verrucomicrobiota bacterium]